MLLKFSQSVANNEYDKNKVIVMIVKLTRSMEIYILWSTYL